MIAGKVSLKRLVPLAATFAALYGTLKLIPISVWIGPSTRVFTATEFISPLLGVVLGPYFGSVAAIVGTFLGITFTGRVNFFGLDFLPIMMNALVLGFLMRKKWLRSVLLYSALLVLFFAHPLTPHFMSVSLPNARIQFPFVWLHIGTWLLLVSPISRRSVEWISGEAFSRATCGACVLTLIGTTAQHLTGTILFASMAVPLMGLTPKALEATWTAVFYIYPVERLIVLVAATTVTLAVFKAMKATRLFDVMGVTKPIREI